MILKFSRKRQGPGPIYFDDAQLKSNLLFLINYHFNRSHNLSLIVGASLPFCFQRVHNYMWFYKVIN